MPAEYAHMPPVDKIFARIGTSDSILGNASTFYLEMQEMELLQTIAENTEAKDIFYVIVTTKEANTVTSFSPPIIFRQRSNGEVNYEMALVGLNTYYAFPNVSIDNNCIKLGEIKTHPKTICLGTGCYEVDEINSEITRQMGWGKDNAPITFKPNNSTLKCIMTIKKDTKYPSRLTTVWRQFWALKRKSIFMEDGKAKNRSTFSRSIVY